MTRCKNVGWIDSRQIFAIYLVFVLTWEKKMSQTGPKSQNDQRRGKKVCVYDITLSGVADLDASLLDHGTNCCQPSVRYRPALFHFHCLEFVLKSLLEHTNKLYKLPLFDLLAWADINPRTEKWPREKSSSQLCFPAWYKYIKSQQKPNVTPKAQRL